MERRLWNSSLPQTLLVSAFLLYANAVVALIFRNGNDGLFGVTAYGLGVPSGSAATLGHILAIAFVVGSVAAGYLITNEKKRGWKLGVGVAASPLIADVLAVVTGAVSISGLISIALLFDVALFVALLHPQSRDHQRIWFS